MGSNLIFKNFTILQIYTGGNAQFQIPAYQYTGGQLERANIKEITYPFSNGFNIRDLGRGQSLDLAKKLTFTVMPFFANADNANAYMLNMEYLQSNYPLSGQLFFADPCGCGTQQTYEYAIITDISADINKVRYCTALDSGYGWYYNNFLKYDITFAKLKDNDY